MQHLTDCMQCMQCCTQFKSHQTCMQSLPVMQLSVRGFNCSKKFCKIKFERFVGLRVQGGITEEIMDTIFGTYNTRPYKNLKTV